MIPPREVDMKIQNIAVGFIAALAMCSSAFANAVPETEAPLRVAVYVGEGVYGIGLFRWLELTILADGIRVFPVTAEGVKTGVLGNMDALVIPGGKSVGIANVLGEEGREKIKAFVSAGGAYIGTCAGCCLAMQPSSCHPGMMGMIPFTFGEAGGKDVADLLVRFHARAETLAGIPRGNVRVQFRHGPVLIPSLPVEDSEMEVIATFASDVNTTSDTPKPSMAGQAAVVAGTYGKGRVFVMAVHPEYDLADLNILSGAFRYATGRMVKWNLPQRRRGQLTFGVVCDDSFGIEAAVTLQQLVYSKLYDLIPICEQDVADGALRHLDGILIPDCLPGKTLRTGLFGRNLARTREFLDREGRIFVWGRATETALRADPRIKPLPSTNVLNTISASFVQNSTPVMPVPKKVAKPLRAAIYADKGGANVPVAEMLALAPEYELSVFDADDFRKGALDGVDLLIQPGGLSKVQYRRLAVPGREALVRYIRNGGTYFGICAGAFLVSQSSPQNARLDLVPFQSDEPEHYRGWAPVQVSFTDDGCDALGVSRTPRSVMYWGGPAFVPGTPLPDTDVKVLGQYIGRTVNTHSPQPVKPMSGKGAFLGGRVGKGRVFLTCPHPEKSESNLDIVRNGIKFLTGTAPSAVNHDRVCGAVSVYFRVAREKKAAQFYLGTLLRDRRFDVRGGSHLYTDALPHLDAVVLPAPLEEEDEAVAHLGDFIAKGGRVVVVVDTGAKQRFAETIKGAVLVDTYDKIPEAILKQ
ncbi:MAG: hypothetical protein J6Z49_04300 [Kiritimatiellae bacterium]|nr:hypothetical protein [Kiritimatiellia bacterium]